MRSTNDIYDVSAEFNMCTATPAQVLDTHQFFNTDSDNWGPVSGTIPTQSVDNSTVSQPAGYYSAFDLSAADTDLAAGNIKSGVTIFGVAGDSNVVDTGAGDAAAGDILTGKKAYIDGSQVDGSVAAGANVSGGNGLKTFTITDGLYSCSKTATANDSDLVTGTIKSGVTIFGVARIGEAMRPFRVCRFYHCASVPPLRVFSEGMSIQAVVPRKGIGSRWSRM